MFSMYAGLGLVPGARNTWSYWIDHILKQRERFGFMAATMITTQGAVSAFTQDFLPTTAEVQVNCLVLGESCSAIYIWPLTGINTHLYQGLPVM